MTLFSHLSRRLALATLAGLTAVTLAAAPARAEIKELRIVQQFGISYLPILVAKNLKLFEAEAAKRGIPDLKVSWLQLGTGQAANEALLSGNIDVAMGGVGPLLTIWDKTRGKHDVRAITALNSMPNFLVTTNPNVKTVKDFTDKDRIAVAAVKSAYQAVILQMAAEQVFGEGQHEKLDPLTVSLKHPDGMVALLSGSEVTAHFTSAPYMYQELQDKRARKVLSSYDVLGGPATFNVAWTTGKFRSENPVVYATFYAAVRQALEIVRTDPARAARIYIEEDKSNLSQEFVEGILRDPENVYTHVPNNILKFSNFMHKIGSIKNKPADWRELFFPELHGEPGS